MKRKVVADAGPIIHLSEVGAVGLIAILGKVLVPPNVVLECHKHIDSSDWRSFVTEKRLSTPQLLHAEMLCKVAGLHLGEAEAIVLAEDLSNSIFLTDDAAARLYASSLEVEVRGTLGLILAAAAKDKISTDDGFNILEKLRKSSLWISDKIYNEAKVALDSFRNE